MSSSSSFNFVKFSHRCVATPLDAKSRLPKPLFERQQQAAEAQHAEDRADDATAAIQQGEESLRFGPCQHADDDDDDGGGGGHANRLCRRPSLPTASLPLATNSSSRKYRPVGPSNCLKCLLTMENSDGESGDFYGRLQALKKENVRRLGSMCFDQEESLGDIYYCGCSCCSSFQPVCQKEHWDSSSDDDDHEEDIGVFACQCQTVAQLPDQKDDNLYNEEKYTDSPPKRRASHFASGDQNCPNSEGQNCPELEAFKTIDSDSEDCEYMLKEDYLIKYQRKRRAKSAPVPRQGGGGGGQNNKKWRPTEVKPFKMTLREDAKKAKQAEAWSLVERAREKSPDDEEKMKIDRSSTVFKASKVPSHVFEPVFQQLVEAQPHRFKPKRPISRRLGSRPLQRAQSAPSLAHGHAHSFRSRPFPAHIFTDFAEERRKEQESYRHVQKEIRQRALLQRASLPPRMEKELQEKTKQKNTPSSASNGHSRRKGRQRQRQKSSLVPTTISVPDFDRLYKRFQDKVEESKQSRLTTLVEPFSFDQQLRGSRSAPHRKSTSDLTSGPSNFVSGRLRPRSAMSHNNSNMSNSKTNLACQLRTQKNAEKVRSFTREEQRVVRRRLELELRQQAMREQNPSWAQIGAAAGDLSGARLREERAEAERERRREYREQLEKMMERLDERPTLFERQSKLNAKQNAAKRYDEVLKKEGLQEEEILRSVRPPRPKPHLLRVRRRRKVKTLTPNVDVADADAKSRLGSQGSLAGSFQSFRSRYTVNGQRQQHRQQQQRTHSISVGSEEDISIVSTSEFHTLDD